MNQTYEDLTKRLAYISLERTYRQNPVIGLNRSREFVDTLYDNVEMMGDIIFSFFPNRYLESDLWREVRTAELNGILIQISRKSVGEIPSGILSPPEKPEKHIDLIGENECYLHNKLGT